MALASLAEERNFKKIDGNSLGKVADNITELAFEIRGYAASIENLLENNKKLHLAWKQQEERNLELVHTIQDMKEEMELQNQNHELQLGKFKDLHLKELQQLEQNFNEKENQFEEEKQKLHKYIITLESKIREFELQRSSVTYNGQLRRSLLDEPPSTISTSNKISKEDKPVDLKPFDRLNRKDSDLPPFHDWEEELKLSASRDTRELQKETNLNASSLAVVKPVPSLTPNFEVKKDDSKKVCPNCRKEKPRKEIFELTNCTHEICSECFEKYLAIWIKMPAPPQCPLGRRKIGNINCMTTVHNTDIDTVMKVKCRQCPKCNSWCKYEKSWPLNSMNCRCGSQFCSECTTDWPCQQHKQ